MKWLAPDRAVVDLPSLDAVADHEQEVVLLVNRWVLPDPPSPLARPGAARQRTLRPRSPLLLSSRGRRAHFASSKGRMTPSTAPCLPLTSTGADRRLLEARMTRPCQGTRTVRPSMVTDSTSVLDRRPTWRIQRPLHGHLSAPPRLSRTPPLPSITISPGSTPVPAVRGPPRWSGSRAGAWGEQVLLSRATAAAEQVPARAPLGQDPRLGQDATDTSSGEQGDRHVARDVNGHRSKPTPSAQPKHRIQVSGLDQPDALGERVVGHAHMLRGPRLHDFPLGTTSAAPRVGRCPWRRIVRSRENRREAVSAVLADIGQPPREAMCECSADLIGLSDELVGPAHRAQLWQSPCRRSIQAATWCTRAAAFRVLRVRIAPPARRTRMSPTQAPP